MSLKRIIMCFSRLAEEGQTEGISFADILAQDKSGYLRRMTQDNFKRTTIIAATKSGWGLSPRTRKFYKY